MKKRKTVLLFGGTVEGRKLYDFCRFQSIPVSLSVASDYGMQALGESVDASVHVGGWMRKLWSDGCKPAILLWS